MTTDKLIADLNQHLASRSLRETAEEQENKYKKLLLQDLTEVGEEDEKGHFVFTFDEGLSLADGRTVRSVKREKRAPLTLDPDAVDKLLPAEHHDTVFKSNVTITGLSPTMAEQLILTLANLGLTEESGQVTEESVIDEDELLSLNYESLVDDDDLKQMYTEGRVVFALKVNYAKS